MNDFLAQQLFFICATMLLLHIPGWFFLSAFFASNFFAPLEKFILSVPASFTIITLSVIIADHFGMSIDRDSLLILLGSITGILIVFSIFTRNRKTTHTQTDLFTFSKKYIIAFIALFLLTIAIKNIYLVNTVFPTSTDLGHHLYWVETIIRDHTLPTYSNLEIIESPNGYALSDPVTMPDFIIGEHILLAAIAIITKMSVITSFPSIVLYVINIYSILTIFILTRRLFDTHRHGALIALLAFLLIGPLWAISGAQAKFASGGVIGNLIGNLLIPTTMYFFYRALAEKSHIAFISAILLATTLAYTHHLSAFIFGYSIIFGLLAFIVFQKDGMRGYRDVLMLFKNPYVIVTLLCVIVWLFFLEPPTYLAKDTIATSVGAPSKSTRIGIPFDQLMVMIGDARFVFGMIGLAIFGITTLIYRISAHQKTSAHSNIYAITIILGWGVATVAMTLMPHILHVNIISSRIATYTAFPLAILAAYAIIWVYTISENREDRTLFIPQSIVTLTLFVCMTYIFASGMKDNATSLNPAPQTNDALQTFHVGNYANKVLNKSITENGLWMVKDHNYITADTWLKIFFAYDYSFPLSRAYFARYESNPDRETCTLEMISDPHAEKAQKCYNDLNVKAVLVSTKNDESQFTSSADFYRIYQNDELSLFIKK